MIIKYDDGTTETTIGSKVTLSRILLMAGLITEEEHKKFMIENGFESMLIKNWKYI